jgi:hypothetical protein
MSRQKHFSTMAAGWGAANAKELILSWAVTTNSEEGSVIGHGIVGKDVPIMARLVKARRWSKRWRICLSSPDLTATQISDGAKIQVRRRHVLRKDPKKS